MDWNRGEHRRKFLKANGDYVEDGILRHGPLTFWGEWEPQSRIIETYPLESPDGPRWLHEPWWEVPRHRQLLQNTDPLVFGDHFLYSNCRQTRNAALRALPAGSLILFGSALKGEFVLDTLFVVAGSGVDYLRGAPDHIIAPDWVRAVVFEPLQAKDERRAEQFRLYSGAVYRDDADGLFSFVPCRPYGPSASAFARPAIRLERRWITPKLAMGAKATPATHDDVRAVWQDVVAQVRDAGLALAVALEPPPDAPPSSDTEAWR